MRRLAVVLAVLLLSGCQGEPARRALVVAASPTPLHTQAPTSRPSGAASPRPRPRPVPRRTAVTAARTTPGPAVRRTTASLPTCHGVPDVGAATQVVLVVGSGTSATVRACQLRAGRWLSVLGTAYGHVGYNGIAPPGAKREGDGRTPSGVFGLGLGFGLEASPGVAFGWRRVGAQDVWVDDSSSALYNTWQEDPANGRWRSAESLDNARSYTFAQVIDYNTRRVPGLGSAIFLHVDHASSTAGCVSVPVAQLLAIFRWERAGAVIAIR